LKLGLVVGSFMLIQMAEGFLISPKVMSESVDVPPLVVMGTLMLGGSIAGVTGMVLAIPSYCILRVLVAEYRKEVRKTFGLSPPKDA
jgi:predicted PurR-regulated permease PerM